MGVLRLALVVLTAAWLVHAGMPYVGHSLVDVGRELYVPWRLTEGDVLYRDVAYFNGPLSPYANALWMKWFGVSVRTLVWANVVVLAATLGAVHVVFRRISGAWPAVMACLTLLLLFAVRQLESIGNYQFLLPYSHEMTHGLCLSFVALALLGGSKGSSRRVLLSGLVAGLVFLTKAEHFLALAVALGGWVLLQPREVRRSATLRLLGGTVVAPVVATLLLVAPLGSGNAVRGVLGSWVGLTNQALTSLPYYATLRGTDDLGASGQRIVAALLGFFVVIGVIASLAWMLRRQERGKAATAAAIAVVTAAGLILLTKPAFWAAAPQAWPVLLVIWAWPSRRAAEGPLRVAVMLFSLVLLAKVLLRARLDHYGFVLTLPATLVVTASLSAWFPTWLKRHGGAAWVSPAILSGLVGAAAWHVQSTTHTRWQERRFELGTGGDRLHCAAPAPVIQQLLGELQANLGPDDTLAVVPEGVMINYLLRRRTPTPHVNFMPPEMILYGEHATAQAFRDSPPDYVVRVHRPAEGYGVRWFGQDFGVELDQWIRANYAVVGQLGDPPLEEGSRFGMQVLRTRP